MAKKNYSLDTLTSPRVVQVLIGILFITMGFIGFSTRGSLSEDFAREIAGLFRSGDSELIRSIVSAILLLSGLILLSSLFVNGIPVKFVTVSKIAILIIWLALIVVLDVLIVNFGSFNGNEWFVWIEQVVIHLIVLVSIMNIRES